MIPIKDYNPTSRRTVVTVVLIAINLVVFFGVQRPYERGLNGSLFTFHYAAIPCEVVQGRPLDVNEVAPAIRDGETTACRHGRDAAVVDRPLFSDKPVYLAILYSMFLHGGLLHIGGNMLFLWIFGNNIEDRMGYIPYLAFYLLGGLVAAAAHILVQPDSTVPIIGASGAIAAVMGAYMVLFPNVRIRSVLIFFFVLIRDIQAKWLLGFWFVLQFFTNPSSGVAWVAHVGGFVFGAVVALVLRDRLRPDPVPIAY